MTSLIKPSADSLSDPRQALSIVLKLYDALIELQQQAAKSSIINLGARSEDPGKPPPGVVYEYTLNGSLKVRTATAAYVVAL